MKIFVDILTPKQCMLFSKLSERLRKRGHRVILTTREYREVVQLLRMKGIEAKVVGKHGGGKLPDKLEASVNRTLLLTSIMKKEKPDVAISFSSPETARTAFGLGIPHVCVNDSPHAEAVAKLTLPLSERLLTPKIIPKRAWTRFGIQANKIIQYNALDPWAWLKDFQPSENVLAQLGLDKSRPILTFRPEETFAAYLLGKTFKTAIIVPIIKGLTERFPDSQAVVVPRYEMQTSLLKRSFGRKVAVCQSIIDAPSLLSFSSVFVGAGGTMTTEAALLGVPTISCYPDKPFLVEKYLIKQGLIAREIDSRKLEAMVAEIMSNLERVKREQIDRAQKITEGFEDPVDVIADTVNKFAHNSV